MKPWLIYSLFALTFFFYPSAQGVELKEGHLIRDAQIERMLKDFISPIFKIAGLNPEKLNLIVIYDSEINASASLDNTIIINTGLMLKADSAAEVIGVLAHETAHIADGHLIRGIHALENATIQSTIGAVLGAVLGGVAGSSELATGVVIGSYEMARGIFLKHSRMQEGSADQGALRYLDALGWTSKGLLSFMKKLAAHDPRTFRDDIYLYTHPLTSERISAFEYHLSKGRGQGGPIPAKLETQFQRVKAKIEAFTWSPEQLASKYSGQTPTDRFVRAVSNFRNSNFTQALAGINQLIQEFPLDPDYWDLKGQILFDSGRVQEAVSVYAQASQLDPKSPLLRELWAQAMLESGDNSLLPQAEQELLRAAKEEPYSPFVWHLLAVAYGKQEKIGPSALALAERNLLEGKFKDAVGQAKRAKKYLAEGDPMHLRADEILTELKRLKKLKG